VENVTFLAVEKGAPVKVNVVVEVGPYSMPLRFAPLK
jgi:hypothetical protein